VLNIPTQAPVKATFGRGIGLAYPAGTMRDDRGFTLIEMLTVMAIIGVLMGITILGLRGMKSRGNFASGTNDVVTAIRECRAQAYGTGATTVFVVDTAGSRWWSLNDAANSFDLTLATFNPASPTPTGGSVIDMNTLPNGVTFNGATAGYGKDLPAPYVGVPSWSSPTLTQAGVPNFNYCSFCLKTGTNAGFGAIRFTATGRAVFSSGPSAIGQSLSMKGLLESGSNVMTIGIIGRTGSLASFIAVYGP
jgi:prepilin-type N-terminal cleavage/methylation domain-containing protein